MKRLAKSALAFVALGLVLYTCVYFAAEQLVQQTGRSNPFFKMQNAPSTTLDWVILGASHAMPLDFSDFNAQMERDTGLKILNLSAPGAGPLYNRFVFEHFLRTQRPRNLLYVVDSFAFYSRTWNEERFADAKLLARTPLEPAVAARFWDYAWREGVNPRAVVDYVSGFSKINNRGRFQQDVWEGESQFERAYRPSSTAVKKRIDYLYPDKTPSSVRDLYLGDFAALLTLARKEGVNVVVIKMPTPPAFHSRLPDETEFDRALAQLMTMGGAAFYDFSADISDPTLYFDTDHLSRAGLTQFFALDLKPLLVAGAK